MNSVSFKAKNISPSITLNLSAMAAKLKQDGADIVSFTAGEPDFNTPNFIVEAAKIAMDKGFTRYTATAGILPLREAICTKLKKDNNLDYTPSQIVVSNGAKHSLYNAFAAILNDGDEVLVPSPYWLTYPEVIKINGGIPKIIDLCTEKDFKLTPKILESAISKKTKAIILNNPSNPSGIVYTKSELEALCAEIEKAGIYLVSDEIYEKLIYDNIEYYSPAQFSNKLKNKTILINGLSKSHAMTGWRMGYSASNIELADAMVNIQSHVTSNPNTIAQYAALEALTNLQGDKFLADLKEVFAARRDYLCSFLDKANIKYVRPNGAFYVMVDVSPYFNKTIASVAISSAADFSCALVEKAKLVTIPLEDFGASNYIRLSYCLKDNEIEKGVNRLKEFIKFSH